MHQFGKIMVVVLLSGLLLLPNVYANPEPTVKQKDREANDATVRIIGGSVVPEGERTFQVALVNENGDLRCSGAIVSSQHVLTSAHCVGNEETLQVLSGTQSLDQGGTLHTIAGSRTHPSYNGSLEDGFAAALIQINGTFPYHLERLKLATPAMMSTHATPGTGAVVSGWGETSNGNISNRLLQTVNHIISDSECQQFAGDDFHADTIICAMDQGNSPCFGDGGAPFTISKDGELYSIGIASFGPGYCGGYSAYAETANLWSLRNRNWIAQHIDIDEGGQVQPGTYRVSNVGSDQCMDVESGSVENGAPILQWPCHDDNNQKWQIEPVGENYSLLAVHSDHALDVPRSSTETIGMIQWPWHGGENQQWKITPVGDDSYEIINVNSDLCLEVKHGSGEAGEIIQQDRCNGDDNQRWVLELVE